MLFASASSSAAMRSVSYRCEASRVAAKKAREKRRARALVREESERGRGAIPFPTCDKSSEYRPVGASTTTGQASLSRAHSARTWSLERLRSRSRSQCSRSTTRGSVYASTSSSCWLWNGQFDAPTVSSSSCTWSAQKYASSQPSWSSRMRSFRYSVHNRTSSPKPVALRTERLVAGRGS